MNGALWLLPLFAVGYALWAFFRLRRMEREGTGDVRRGGAALSSTRATPGHKLP